MPVAGRLLDCRCPKPHQNKVSRSNMLEIPTCYLESVQKLPAPHYSKSCGLRQGWFGPPDKCCHPCRPASGTSPPPRLAAVARLWSPDPRPRLPDLLRWTEIG